VYAHLEQCGAIVTVPALGMNAAETPACTSPSIPRAITIVVCFMGCIVVIPFRLTRHQLLLWSSCDCQLRKFPTLHPQSRQPRALSPLQRTQALG
jgi:hypothetical protein